MTSLFQTGRGARFCMFLKPINVRMGMRTIGRLAGVLDDPSVNDGGVWTVGGMFRCIVLSFESFFV